jgi:hypothetical protein
VKKGKSSSKELDFFVERECIKTTIETTFRSEGGDKAMGNWKREEDMR